jgi:hypothetical protein
VLWLSQSTHRARSTSTGQQSRGFATPGSPDSAIFPDANGNYTDGKSWSLLGESALCHQRTNGVANRQITNGIQSGCV